MFQVRTVSNSVTPVEVTDGVSIDTAAAVEISNHGNPAFIGDSAADCERELRDGESVTFGIEDGDSIFVRGGGSGTVVAIFHSGEAAGGAAGPAGADGNTVLNGSGAPDDSADGVDGDFYIDTDAWDIYGPKASGAWGDGTSLVGPPAA